MSYYECVERPSPSISATKCLVSHYEGSRSVDGMLSLSRTNGVELSAQNNKNQRMKGKERKGKERRTGNGLRNSRAFGGGASIFI